MSCNEGFVNVSNNNTKNICDSKCVLNFSFTETTAQYYTLNAGPDNNTIKLTGVNTNDTIFFNENTYTYLQTAIYGTSSNEYNGTNAPGEIIVVCSSQSAGYLTITIPIQISNFSNTQSNILSTIINSTNGDISSIQLNYTNFIPSKKPFFFYSSDIIGQCSNNIIFPIENSSLFITQETFTKLTSITKPLPGAVNDNILCFYNKNGGNSNNSSDIYIDCKPTDASEETIGVGNNFTSGGSSLTPEEQEKRNQNNDKLMKMALTLLYYASLIIVGIVILFICISFIKLIKNSLVK